MLTYIYIYIYVYIYVYIYLKLGNKEYTCTNVYLMYLCEMTGAK